MRSIDLTRATVHDGFESRWRQIFLGFGWDVVMDWSQEYKAVRRGEVGVVLIIIELGCR